MKTTTTTECITRWSYPFDLCTMQWDTDTWHTEINQQTPAHSAQQRRRQSEILVCNGQSWFWAIKNTRICMKCSQVRWKMDNCSKLYKLQATNVKQQTANGKLQAANGKLSSSRDECTMDMPWPMMITVRSRKKWLLNASTRVRGPN